MKRDHVRMAANGRVVIPARVRSELGIGGGETFVVEVEDGVIKLVPFSHVIRRVQEEIRRYIPAGRSLAEELSEERRREAELE
jgi:antitoxin PrlF